MSNLGLNTDIDTNMALKIVENATLNAKGANAWNSTLNSLVDLFTIGTKKFPKEYYEFNNILNIVEGAFFQDPDTFVKILKLHRLIMKGNGIKWIYYLCMMILKINMHKNGTPEKYEKVLEWSWEYPKDLMNLCRLSNTFGPFPNSKQESLILENISKVVTKRNTTVHFIDLVPQKNIKNLKHVASSLGTKTKTWSKHNLSQNSTCLEFELIFYAENVFKLFKNLITSCDSKPDESEPNDSKPKSEINPMFLKYMGYETGHWAIESKLIWAKLEQLINSDDSLNQFIGLSESSEQLDNKLGNELRQILKSAHESSLNLLNSQNQPNVSKQTQSLLPNNYKFIFTNKTRRLIKKCFNSNLNLLDNLFKGVHSNGKKFGWTAKENLSENIEITDIANQLKRSASLAFDRFEKTVKTYDKKTSRREREQEQEQEQEQKQTIELTLKQNLLLKGYHKYLEMLKTGEAQVKTRGLDVSTQVWEFFISDEIFSQSIESKLEQMVKDLSKEISNVVGEEKFNELADKFEIILDISGSMNGSPIQIGLLYMCLMTKVFGIKRLFYFESNFHQNILSDEILKNGNMCELVKKIYKRTTGSTNLEGAFNHIRTEGMNNKNIIIITDGDCDPSQYSSSSSNPFHNAPKGDCGLNYIVLNVKETKMNFPYLGIDPNVCYITGSNPKTINGLIKALVESSEKSIKLTPSLVLKHSLDSDEFAHQFNIVCNNLNPLAQNEIEKLFDVFVKNQPPEKDEQQKTIDLNSDSDSDSDSDRSFKGLDSSYGRL